MARAAPGAPLNSTNESGRPDGSTTRPRSPRRSPGAVLRRLDDDIFDLLFRQRPRGDHELKRVARRDRRLSNSAGGHLHVLRCHDLLDFVGLEVLRRQAAGIQPDLHGVIRRPDHVHPLHPGQLFQPRAEFLVRVVGQVQRIELTVRALHRDPENGHGARVALGDHRVGDGLGEGRPRQGHAVANQRHGCFEIDIRLEVEDDAAGTRSAGGAHQGHALGPVQLLLQRGDDGVHRHLRVGPQVRRRHVEDDGRRVLGGAVRGRRASGPRRRSEGRSDDGTAGNSWRPTP